MDVHGKSVWNKMCVACGSQSARLESRKVMLNREGAGQGYLLSEICKEAISVNVLQSTGRQKVKTR